MDDPYSPGSRARRTTRDDRESVRWRNGQGTTQVIAETDLWRVSIADEPTSSTFSVIDGYDRFFVPIGAVPIELSGPPFGSEAPGVVRHVVAPLQTIEFPGEWAPRCRVETPTRALNVMVRRGRATATVRIGEPPAVADPAALLVLVDPVTEDAVLLPPGCADAFEMTDPCAVLAITTLHP
ncbi:HutD family protein [Prescottella agglutinans]|uniref:HutD family protein n=1 Tax=Prescottella agglutinans TaxID=1644129 RepID=UPI001F4E4521|nr:HutD family protein [Prescottella agglutinans]